MCVSKISLAILAGCLVFTSSSCDKRKNTPNAKQKQRDNDAAIRQLFPVFEVPDEIASSESVDWDKNSFQQYINRLEQETNQGEVKYGKLLAVAVGHYYLDDIDASRFAFERLRTMTPNTLHEQLSFAYACYLLGEDDLCVDVALASYDANQRDGRPLLLAVLVNMRNSKLTDARIEECRAAAELLEAGFPDLAMIALGNDMGTGGVLKPTGANSATEAND